MQSVELSACPICGGPLVPLGVTETYDLKPALALNVPVEFAICSACSFVCQQSVLPLDMLMQYYGNSPKLRCGMASESDASLYVHQADFMSQTGELRSKRMLDIGADMGKLLD